MNGDLNMDLTERKSVRIMHDTVGETAYLEVYTGNHWELVTMGYIAGGVVSTDFMIAFARECVGATEVSIISAGRELIIHGGSN